MKLYKKVLIVIFTGILPGILIVNHLEAKEQKLKA
jgi:hypothetical protein